MKNLLLFFLFSLIIFSTNAQTASIIKFGDLEKYLNKTNDTLYVINFWATWCKPCIEELPYFEQLNLNYKNSKVKVVLISLDFTKNFSSTLLPYLKRKQIKSEVYLLDEPNYNAWINKVSPEWSGAIPASIFINGSKKARSFYEKSFTFEELEKTVKENVSQ